MSTEWLKSLVPAPARSALKRLLGIPQTIDPDWQILASIGPVNRPHVVFDAGAFKGYFSHCWRKWCPQAEVHAFEPSTEACDLLQQKFTNEPFFHLNQVGLGETEGQMEYHVASEARSCNSFLPPNEKTLDEMQYRVGAVTTRTVPVTTLDAYCRQAKIAGVYLIKIDVQGFELNVLKGGAQVALPLTDYILVESAIRPLYVGAPRFSDVFEYLTAHGFHLIGLRTYHRGNLTLMETDLLFRRDALMPPVDPNLKVDKISVSTT